MALLPYSCKMSRISKKFGKKVRDLRENGGLSQLELAQDSGLDVTTINELENGHRDPLLATIKKIAKALHVSIDALMS